MREITYLQAMQEALEEEMARDETVFVLGMCVRGGALGVTKGLVEKFGSERLVDTGVNEDAIAGSCVGAALAGFRPIAEYQCSDFLYISADQICNKAAKWRFRHGGKPERLPIVFMVSTGGYFGSDAEHSQSVEAVIMHSPGIRIAFPSSPYDAKGLLKEAIRDDNPVVYLHHKLMYPIKEGVPEEEYTVPFGVANIKREGKDVTVVAIGYMVSMASSVADALQDHGVSVEVIDLRTLVPLDIEAVVASVKKTRRVVIVDEDTSRCGVAAEIGMQIMEKAFGELDAPIVRVAAANCPIPAGFFLHQYVLPQPKDIVAAIERVLGRNIGPVEIVLSRTSLIEFLDSAGAMMGRA